MGSEKNQLDLVLSMRMPDNLYKSKVIPLAVCDMVRASIELTEL